MISRCLSLSMEHITPITKKYLDNFNYDDCTYPISVAPFTYGFIINYLDTFTMEDESICSLPYDLRMVIKYAKEVDCTMVVLDADAEYIEGLQQYNWKKSSIDKDF